MDLISTTYYIFLFAICSTIVWKSSFFSDSLINKREILFAYWIKLIGGFAIFLIYTYIYSENNRDSLDTFKLFDDGKALSDIFWKDKIAFIKIFFGLDFNKTAYSDYYSEMNHWFKAYNYGEFNDNQTLIRFNALLHFISFGNYHIHSLILNLLSLYGILALLSSTNFIKNNNKIWAFRALILFPSIWLWGSGLLKEGLLIFALGYFLYRNAKFLQHQNLSNLALLIFAFFILVQIKTYVIAFMIPGIIALWLFQFGNNSIQKYAGILGLSIFLITLFSAALISDDFNILKKLSIKQRDFINISAGTAGSYFGISRFDGSLIGFIKLIPEAISNALFRPFIWQTNKIMGLIASLENIILASLFLFGIWNSFLKEKFSHVNLYISASILLLITIGITSPVAGAIIRYKVPVDIFIILLFFSCFKIPKSDEKQFS